MKDEWKKFLIQWVLPCGVFGVILIFLIASFNANIHQKAADEYQETLVTSTVHYARNIQASFDTADSVGRVVADLLGTKNYTDEECLDLLTAIVRRSDAYMAIRVDHDGKAISDANEKVDFSGTSYFETVCTSSEYTNVFVPNDGIMGNPAMIISIPVNNETAPQNLLVYYPVNAPMLKKMVTVSSDYDNQGFSVLMEKDGTILVSTRSDDRFALGNNVWDALSTETAASNVRRVKTRVQAGNQGSFEMTIDNASFIGCFVPIPSSSEVLLVGYSGKSVESAEAKMSEGIVSKISWIAILTAVFLIVVSVINIVQIYIASKNTEDLKDKADTDQLTGLKNKIATEREIKEYIEEHPDSLAMMFLIDIDNFKKINDTMGHAFGDEVLRELGRHIGINFRVSDIIGRSGGDEFTIFLKNLKEDANTLREAQKLVYFFRHFQVGDYVKYTVTASIGAAVFPANGADFETLYKAADAAVYKSKKRGKNQLSFFDDRDKTPEEVAEADSHLIDISRKEETPIES